MLFRSLVFGEFARKLQPAIVPFVAYDPTLHPEITAEFAHAIYRFGHSMLNEDVKRTLANGTTADTPLLSAFLNPPSFTQIDSVTVLDADVAAGAVVRGEINDRGNEIDEFVTPTLRNSLLGAPLDLATLNLVRGRDTGMQSLNGFRSYILDRKSTRLNSSHSQQSRMPSSA